MSNSDLINQQGAPEDGGAPDSSHDPSRGLPSDGLPATLGGRGWRNRDRSLREEVREGIVWRRCGVSSETGRLREVLLAWPSDAFLAVEEPDRHLMLGGVDLDELRCEARALGRFYEEKGVGVHWIEAPSAASPNLVFVRDLFWMTPEGAVVSRMAPRQRAGEERYVAAALAALGIPILMTLRGRAAFEGADALWLNRALVLVGVGKRTNEEGFRQVSALLKDMGVRAFRIPLDGPVQHLLGVVNFIRSDLAVLHRVHASDVLVSVLKDAGVRTIEVSPGEEIDDRRGMNFVTLAPGEVVMPEECPVLRERMEKEAVRCHVLDVHQYIRAAGAIGCVTGILYREEEVAEIDVPSSRFFHIPGLV